ncbi:hypothetical protein C6P46_001080 [Rhodotorula mucilaginosa]|uniref:Uncharacterized protein n=1 Tax=Rhodotorula mucilaginosa TaxID=5537 RepID=A0A9P6VUE2_RHOMI|nr:hypothetical protein C6P46_001080 [Rhodotorula mucilaginosa]
MTDSVQESIKAFNSHLENSSKSIREAWRTLLNSDNRDDVLKMRKADYALHSVPRKIKSIEEQLKTKKSTKGRARLTELKERLEAASD